MGRARAIQLATENAEKYIYTRRMTFSVRNPGGTKGVEDPEQFLDVPEVSLLLVYCENINTWTCSISFISSSDNTEIFQTLRGRRIFRSTIFKPWIKALLDPFYTIQCNLGPFSEYRL